jgi:nucleotide-binding universal stress UspA family protein
MYRNLLVPIADDAVPERTDAAIAVARALMAPDGKLDLLHVTEAVPDFVAAYIPKEAQLKVRQDAEAMLEAVAARAGVAASTAVITGHGGGSIVDHAKRHGTDCIVVSSHRPEIQDVFFGSTAAHVVRHAPCAVHVLR